MFQAFRSRTNRRRECLHLFPAVDHHLQGIGQLKLPSRAHVPLDFIAQAFDENVRPFDIIDSNERKPAFGLLGLFDEFCDPAVLGLSDPEPTGVVDLLHSKNRTVGSHKCLQINIKHRIAQNDEDWIPGDRVTAKVDCVP
jgi:hypothetical protein